MRADKIEWSPGYFAVQLSEYDKILTTIRCDSEESADKVIELLNKETEIRPIF